VKCADCAGGPPCFRRECLPQFQEDRLRLYRNPRTGDRYSYALGDQMPESRAERDALEKSRGIVFCSPGENASTEHAAANAYEQARRQGASHEEAERYAPWPKAKQPAMKPRVDAWAKKRVAEGKPLDRLVDSEMTPELAQAGFKQVS
jgi:hypothetical protein